ncbi:MAG: hypothetical protein FJ405_10240, partial [Verrucomicrobia bacterium]|nr:hypothetical protein [Verrucomicrobiota bacterium]
MSLDHAELLLRLLDGKLPPEERERAIALLRSDAAARAFLREVAEQAVMLSDIERSTEARLRTHVDEKSGRSPTASFDKSRA